MGAVAWALEDLIEQAPGDPVPRAYLVLAPGGPELHLAEQGPTDG